jgi:eukaryotic-like serine/threonine-protein kinase
MPRDLETICLKCLQKDPARRYPDVAAVAEDLRRFRSGEPIVARPISAAERAWRWCKRNRKVAALSATVAVLLVLTTIGTAVAAVTFRRQSRAPGKANAGLTQANSDLAAAYATADAERRRAVEAGQAFMAQNQEILQTQRELIEFLEDRLRHVPGLKEVREKMLDIAALSLESAVGRMTDLRPKLEFSAADEELSLRSLARAHQRIGELRLARNQFAEVMKTFQQVDEIVARFAAAAPDDPAAQIRLVRSQRQLGYLAREVLGDTEAARRHFGKALEIIRRFAAKDPSHDGYKTELANSLGQLAIVERQLGHLQEARALFEEELATRESLSPEWASKLEPRRELSGLHEQLADLYFLLGDRARAEPSCALCTRLREVLAAERPEWWPTVYDLARSYNNEGFLRFPRGNDPGAAREFHRKAIAVFTRRAQADPANLDAPRRLAEADYYEATCALHSGDPDGAAAGYRRCLEIRRKLASDPLAKMSRIDLMVALARCGEHAAAAAIARDLVATPPNNEQIYFQSACGFALATGAARDERRRLQSACGPLRDAIVAGLDAVLVRIYISRAVDCLRRARRRGWADVVSLETDPDLAPIRDDPAFRALLAEFPRPGGRRP